MKKTFSRMDFPLLLLTIIFTIIGLVMIFSASSVSAVLRYGVNTHYFFMKQAIVSGIAFVLGFIIILHLPISKYKYFVPFLVLGVMAALIGLFTYGKIAGGAQSWYNFGLFNLQPVEFTKSILIIYYAIFYSKITSKPNVDQIMYLIPLGVAIVFCLFVAMQPDLGGALIIAAMAFLLFISIPKPKKIVISLTKIIGVGIVILIIAVLLNWKTFFNSNQIRRFQFHNPCERYREATGYQVCNGFIAIHNGNILYPKLGDSTQKYLYLPEAHTDFIFPIIVEELGLVIGVLLILGYGYMLYRILKIAKNAENIRNSLLAYGTFLFILFHIFVNLLGVLAIIPLTGVPLPLLSYGGSFNLNVLIMLFVVQRVAIETANIKRKKEIANM